MNRLRAVLAAMLAIGLSGCIVAAPPPPLSALLASAEATPKPVVTILVSIDGFRPDYLNRGVTPRLNALAAAGVSAPMTPSFPSKTFPNHWSLVTGEVPDRHGIVANRMEDPARPGETFTMASDDPFWWNAASPIWVDAEKAGIRTATMFWPGANVAWGGTRATAWPHDISGGTRPEDWQQFNQVIANPQRVNAVLDWLRRPAAIRPRFVTLYVDTVDTAGHIYGPDDARTTAAIADADAAIGMLVDGLATLRQPANLVIVSDHGMAATSSDRVIALDGVADPGLYRIVESGPYAALVPTEGNDATLAVALLAPHEHMQCWRKAAIPARFQYGANPRVPPFLCLAETGWSILPTTPATPFTGGNHGYDNQAPDMAALFVAHGPAFARGQTLPAFPNVDVEPLLRDLLAMPLDAAVDGTDTPFTSILIQSKER
ncbi:ectonucleotide pyrophosphatase/phosphodiesterase [Hephaestia sp. GCM10023244]|uniref:alkaline phosphatase family protein n=1 Tax=unclassified Hephaestia TaxID=2631281 RepID=UPI00207782F3|nr:ectonucleotide pyrophosphatase/phosphodiesterase [Hephaestia sp. MAHUQ-44]MCM8729456.1 ectonucleotide pyrophosphatase/phosphodiesterase [Hephaestia sp. MAHUQ-44]